MDIAQEIFDKKRVLMDRLEEAGFARVNEGAAGSASSDKGAAGDPAFVYREKFMDGDLTAVVRILPDGAWSCSVIDSESGDEYLPMNIEAYTGTYVGKARDEYRKLLEKIAEKCFVDEAPVKKRGKRYWLIPSNPATFDVGDAFRASGNDTLDWHHRISVMPGDIVYIYQTEPIASIMWECEVLESYLPRPESWGEYAQSSKYMMILKRLRSFEKGEYPRSWMNEHGIIKTVRGQRSAPPELVAAIAQ